MGGNGGTSLCREVYLGIFLPTKPDTRSWTYHLAHCAACVDKLKIHYAAFPNKVETIQQGLLAL